MQANERGFDRREIAEDDGYGFHRFVLNGVGDDLCRAMLGGEYGFGRALDEFFAHAAMGDELFDGNDRQVELGGEGVELVTASTVAIFAQDFANEAGWLEARHAGEIDGGLGVAGSTEDAPFLGNQWKDVSRSNEVGGCGGVIAEGADGGCAFAGGDACLGGDVIDGNGVVGLERGVVERRIDHRRQAKPIGSLWQQGHTKLTPAVCDHEVDSFGGRLLGCRDEIALVLTILGIDDNDDTPRGKGFDRLFDSREVAGHDGEVAKE